MNKKWMRNYATLNPNGQGVEQLEKVLADAPDMKILAVTGTVGKTTVMELLYEYLIACGRKVMMVGTNGIYCRHAEYVHNNFPSTSPTSEEMLFLLMLGGYAYKCEYFLLEVTAETMSVDIYDGIDFESLSVVNIKRDIVKSFSTDEEYVEAKQTLLLNNTINHIICNRDANDYYNILLNDPRLHTYNPSPQYSLTDGKINIYFDGRVYNTNLYSSVNLQNLACVLNTIKVLGLLDTAVLNGVLSTFVAEGRLEHFELEGRTIVIDTYYGGVLGLTPYLEDTVGVWPRTISVLSSYYFGNPCDKHADILQHRQGRAELVAKYSNAVILTATMARRGEDPSETREQLVIDHLLKGAPKGVVVYNRLQAIHTAWANSQPGDRIMILGMGTETWARRDGINLRDKEIIKIIADKEK